jgi:hypothetical protein
VWCIVVLHFCDALLLSLFGFILIAAARDRSQKPVWALFKHEFQLLPGDLQSGWRSSGA